MNAGNWIELVALLVSILGGGAVGVSKLTRLIVAAETAGQLAKDASVALGALGDALTKLGTALGATQATVQDHETRLSALEPSGQTGTKAGV